MSRRPARGRAPAVTALGGTATKVRLRLAVPGEADVTLIVVARDDGRPAWAETGHLSLCYVWEPR